jgi:hypothetical protein
MDVGHGAEHGPVLEDFSLWRDVLVCLAAEPARVFQVTAASADGTVIAQAGNWDKDKGALASDGARREGRGGAAQFRLQWASGGEVGERRGPGLAVVGRARRASACVPEQRPTKRVGQRAVPPAPRRPAAGSPPQSFSTAQLELVRPGKRDRVKVGWDLTCTRACRGGPTAAQEVRRLCLPPRASVLLRCLANRQAHRPPQASKPRALRVASVLFVLSAGRSLRHAREPGACGHADRD